MDPLAQYSSASGQPGNSRNGHSALSCVAFQAPCCSSSGCDTSHNAASSRQQWWSPAPSSHSSCLQTQFRPQLVQHSHSCITQQQSHHTTGSLRSRAARLTPPSASLAFVEPATAASGAAGAAAGTASAAAVTTAGSLNFSKVLAVVLGYCVMAGSLFRSVPQIIKVIKHNSTEGLSLVSYLVELCCYSVVIAYNMSQGYGFNTYGEVVACWIQDIILIALVFKDRRTPPWLVVLSAAAFTAGCSFLMSPACPHQLLSTMQASNIAIMALGSRLPQIILNMRRGNAGMLSVTTCLLNVAGNAARIFTTIVLTGDLLMLGGACSQGCLNTILLYQSISTARARAQAKLDEGSATGSSSSTTGPSSLQQQQQQQQHGQPLRQHVEGRPSSVGPSHGSEAASGGFPSLQPAT